MSRALILQHLDPEGAALIASSLRAAGVEPVVHRCDLDPVIPALDEFAAVVVMGGPMDSHRDDGFPTRRAELALLERALADEVPVLGVCLGAQLLAIAAGGSAFPGDMGREIGWAPITLAPAARDDALFGALAGSSADGLTVLHWHGDTFALPPGATLLASSERYEHQAFRVGSCAWGLQFHIEVDVPTVHDFLAAFAHEAVDAPGGVLGMVKHLDARIAALAPARAAVLDGFARLVADGNAKPNHLRNVIAHD